VNTRRLAAAALVAVLPLAAIACGDKTKDAAPATTTAKKTEKKSSSPTTTADPGPQTSFNDGLAQLQTELAAAKGDVCKLLAVGNSQGSIADPATADEVKAAGDFTADFLKAIADTAPSDGSQQAAADTIRKSAEAIPGKLEAANYDPKLVTGSNGIISGDAELLKALGQYQTAAEAACGVSTTTTP